MLYYIIISPHASMHIILRIYNVRIMLYIYIMYTNVRVFIIDQLYTCALIIT